MDPSSASILILDDDADVAFAARMLLRRRHGEVTVLHDPARLPALLAQGAPDVVQTARKAWPCSTCCAYSRSHPP
jgi:DNA-binding NtrC family response regulator